MSDQWMELEILQKRLIESQTKEITRLRDAIIKHRDQKGDDRCWVDDHELYRQIGNDTSETNLPPKCEFLESCSRFWEQRQNPADDYASSSMTMAQLEDELTRLRSINAELLAALYTVQQCPKCVPCVEAANAAIAHATPTPRSQDDE